MKNKGFTLVELLATILILAILIAIGTMVVTNIFDNTKINYYKSEENTLSIAGNEYFNDNRDDKPIDDYNFVDLKTLQEHEYLEELKTYDGKDLCDPKSGVYIYNDNGTNYETCLICGDYRSPGPFCNGKTMGTIKISGNLNSTDGPSYNPLLSYSGTSWVNASTVYIHFGYEDEEGKTVTSYKIYNSTSSTLYTECTDITNNNCTKEIPTTGSYYVEAFGSGGKIGNRKYFNVKIDNIKPKYDVEKGDEDIILKDDEIYYNYENEILNITDDNGYKSVTYTLTRYNPTYPANTQIICQDVDIKDKDLKISQNLASGRYDLYITVKDFAGNVGESSNSHIRFYIKYNVDMKYYDVYDQQHDAGRLEVYTYGKYEQVKSTNTNGTYSETVEKSLPKTLTINGRESEPISWFKDANFSGTAISKTTLVSSTGYHILYGKEGRKKTKFTSACIKKDGGNLVYNMDDQQLVTEGTGYSLIVYYDNKKTNNLGHDAGTYTVIAVLDSMYEWEDGTRSNKYVQCTIDPAPVNVPSCKNPTYNGYYQELVEGVGDNILYSAGVPTSLPHDAELNSYVAGKEQDFIIHGPYGKNAHDYTVSFSLASTNFIWSDKTRADKEIHCKINPLSTKVEWSNLTFTYDGNSHSPTATAKSALSYYTIKFDVPGAINAGTHNTEATCSNVSSTLTSEGDLCSNYTFTNTTTKFTINKKSISVVWTTPYSFTYDGSPHAPAASVSTGVGKEVMTLSTTKETNVHSNWSQSVYPYTSTATCSKVTNGQASCDNYTLTNTTHGYNIVPKAVTITSDSATKEYDGTALTKNSVTGTGLVSGHTAAGTVTGTITNVGSTSNTVTGCKVMSGSTDVSSNYTITCNAGTLKVTKKSVTITSDSASKTYDGTALTKNSVTGSGLVSGHTATGTVTGSRTSAGESNNTVTGCKVMSGTTDVSSNYTITCSAGKLTVNKREITITSGSASKTYDGTALTKNTVSGNNLVSGHTATGTVTGSRTSAGTSNNTVSGCKVMSGSTDVSSNYTITCSAGKLTVNPATATVCSCNTNAKANGSDVICTGGSNITVTPSTTTTSGNNKVTVTANTNYAFSDGTTSKEVTCSVAAVPSDSWPTSDVSSCNKYYYSFSYECSSCSYGCSVSNKSKTGTGYSSESAARTACGTAMSGTLSCPSGESVVDKPSSCSSGYVYTHWSIVYKKSDGKKGTGGPYASKETAKANCNGKDKCFVTCG